MGTGDGGPSQLSSYADARAHQSQGLNQRPILEVADPDWREALVVGCEWKQEAAAHDGDVRHQGKVALKVGKTGEMGMAVAGGVGRKALENRGSRFNEKALSDGSSNQRLDDRKITCITAHRTGKETYPARDERRFLCYALACAETDNRDDYMRRVYPGHRRQQ